MILKKRPHGKHTFHSKNSPVHLGEAHHKNCDTKYIWEAFLYETYYFIALLPSCPCCPCCPVTPVTCYLLPAALFVSQFVTLIPDYPAIQLPCHPIHYSLCPSSIILPLMVERKLLGRRPFYVYWYDALHIICL